MSTNVQSPLCKNIITTYQPEWDEFLHDISTELAIGTQKLSVNIPDSLNPMLAVTLPAYSKKPIILINSVSEDIAEQWGIQHIINDQLSEQELDGTISTKLSLAMHSFCQKTAGSYFIPRPLLDMAAPSGAAYHNLQLSLTLGQTYSISDLIKKLVKMGYTRHNHAIAGSGFFVRGDEVRIMHPLFEYPLIISFFGNSIDKIITTNNNRKKAEQAFIIPPLRFPNEKKLFQESLAGFISLGKEKDIPKNTKISIITDIVRPSLQLPERLQSIQMPVIPSSKRKSSRIYSSPISQERALELIGKLTPGKPAVHADHGIGMFEGLEKRMLHHEEHEYIILRYADGDTLSIPVAFAHKVSPYIGESSPVLYRLGGTVWQKTKRKAQQDAAAFAKELIAINKKREEAKRNPYTIDPHIEKNLVQTFPHELTQDQITTWEEIQHDMRQDIPMDRLVVGDVGFGKTELAMRAARHAFANGKQIALLAPTTLLVQQHADTFRERLSAIEDSIFLISRFSSKKEITQAKKIISEGKPVIIIGTHAILSHSIPWKNLSMLIIDEEQRFGVKQKEHLKKMRATIDILSLSATPIPRTLSMALSGLRSLSVIATAPKGRKNIETKIQKVSDTALRTTITTELERNGQIYIVASKIRSLGMIKETIQALIPHCRTEIAHAKLADEQLGAIIHAFDTHEIDILISSSIVENGLDLPNANTMIVWDAPHFGLAQLYQLRGRIGRRSRQGHALFLYSQEKLTDMQRERLTALTESTRQGSGWDIARRDLELRGAGNILGAEQSGSASAVGMYMYLDMIDSAEEEQERADIHTLLPAFIPSSYIPDADSRTMWYIRLSRSKNSNQLQEYIHIMQEEFGIAPEEVQNLSRMIRLQKAATASGILSMQTKTITPNDEEPYIRIIITCKDPVKLLEKLSHIKNQNNSPARWQARENTLSWDTEKVTPELIGQFISSLE
ncbi:MAG TPA: DEAD/DEAH box helicase [Candidatus Andersenbacteria bacterium]|nr:DEAD/DEAH box helicase [Candidatus Andersenbacteria bacterium]